MTDYTAAIRRRIRRYGQVAPVAAAPSGPPCRACLAPLEAAFQPGWGGRPGYAIYTCRNAACALHRYTFSAPDYDTLDLGRYRAVEHEQYRSMTHGDR